MIRPRSRPRTSRASSVVRLPDDEAGDPLDERGTGGVRSGIPRGAAVTGSAFTPPPTPNTTWPAYGMLAAPTSSQHPDIQQATVNVEVSRSPRYCRDCRRRGSAPTSGMTSRPIRAPPSGTTVLATIDESTYSGGTMGADSHPLVWTHATAGGGRAIHTAMGHTTRAMPIRCSASTSPAPSAGPRVDEARRRSSAGTVARSKLRPPRPELAPAVSRPDVWA